MLRLFCVALSLLFIVAPASAETAESSSLPFVLVNDASGAISESQNTPRQNRPVRKGQPHAVPRDARRAGPLRKRPRRQGDAQSHRQTQFPQHVILPDCAPSLQYMK